MNMEHTIEKLCRQYTDLNDEEINVIQMMAKTLQPLANMEAANMFIDCRCKEGDAIVVAEAKPEEAPSAYKSSVVGMLAKAENEPAVARTFNLGIATKFMQARTQEDNYTIQSVEPILFNSRIIGVLIREKCITEPAEEQIESKKYQAVEVPIYHMVNENEWLTEGIDEGLILVDTDGRVCFRNMYAKTLFHKLGYVSDILGQSYRNICLTKWDETSEDLETLKEVRYGKYYLWIRQIPLKNKNGIILAVIFRDITGSREQERNLILKSVAMKELNHRVKNNLQMVASLLRLQARRVGSVAAKRALEESIDRILSMAVSYEFLSHSEGETVSLKKVLGSIRNNTLQSLARPELKVDIRLEGDDMMVDSDVAVPAALAVNELLHNSMKYAFEGRDHGSISITLKKGTVYSEILVKDDGVGFQPEHTRKDSLGLNIVKMMVEDKLHGKLRIRSGTQGTSVSIDFIRETADFIEVSE